MTNVKSPGPAGSQAKNISDTAMQNDRDDGAESFMGSHESDVVQQKPSLNRASSLLTSWLQGFNRKSLDLGTFASDSGNGQSHDRTRNNISQNDASRDSTHLLFRSSSSPRLDNSIGSGVVEAEHFNTFEIDRPILCRNVNRNQQSDFMEAHNPSGRLNKEEQFSFDPAETFRANAQEIEFPFPLHPCSHVSRVQNDEVEELREFLTVSRTYDECFQFFLNLNSSSVLSSKQNGSYLCLQSDLEEARSQLLNLSMELDLEKSNCQKNYENFHIAVWVSAFLSLQRLNCSRITLLFLQGSWRFSGWRNRD